MAILHDLRNLLAGYVINDVQARSMARTAGVPVNKSVQTTDLDTTWSEIIRLSSHQSLTDLIEDVVSGFKLDDDQATALRETGQRYLATRIKKDKTLTLRNRKPRADHADHYDDLIYFQSVYNAPPATLRDLLYHTHDEFSSTPIYCVVAHYAQDIELSLSECVRECVPHRRYDDLGQDHYEDVWIRGDQLWQAMQPAHYRNDLDILRQLMPAGYDIQEFAAEFENLLEGEIRYTFVLDFSRMNFRHVFTPTAAIDKNASIVSGVDAFMQNVCARGHQAIIGLPRFVLGIPVWRELVESIRHRFVAAHLFGCPEQDQYNRSVQDTKPLNGAMGMLNNFTTVNSVSLKKIMTQEAERFSGLAKSLSIKDQLKELISIAGRLLSNGFVEPAYRIELWCRTYSPEMSELKLRADVVSGKDQHGKVFGQISDIGVLPKAGDRIILTGESGQGKTMALRLIESQWAVPAKRINGSRYTHWLPILLTDLNDPEVQVSQNFANATFTQLGPGVRLAAHSELAKYVTAGNIGWVFSSPVLYLIDGLDTSHDASSVSRWLGDLFHDPYNSPGIISAHRDIGNAPFRLEAFRAIFPENGYVHASMRPLDLTEARRLCPDEAHKAFIERLFLDIDGPLNLYVRNFFLVKCLCAIRKINLIPAWCSLSDLLELYVREQCSTLPNNRVIELIDVNLPRLAQTIYADGEVVLSPETVNMAIQAGLLSPKNPKEFAHPLLTDFFYAKYLCAHWNDESVRLKNILGPVTKEMWVPTYGNLFKMLARQLKTDQQTGFLDYLAGQQQHRLIHLCLLDLDPTLYQGLRAYTENTTAALLSEIERQNDQQEIDPHRALESKKEICHVLSYYDPRLPDHHRIRDSFVQITSNPESENLFIGKYPVTNKEFCQFIKEDGYNRRELWKPLGWEWLRGKIKSPAYWTNLNLSRPNYPVVGISYYEALAFTRWLTEKMNRTASSSMVFSIPSELEWSLAARVAHAEAAVEDDPWVVGGKRDELLDNALLLLREQRERPSTTNVLPIGLYPPNAAGIHDLLGNVWQWCDTWYGDDGLHGWPSANDDDAPAAVLVRGGPVVGNARMIGSLIGGGLDPFSRVNNVGFRTLCRMKT